MSTTSSQECLLDAAEWPILPCVSSSNVNTRSHKVQINPCQKSRSMRISEKTEIVEILQRSATSKSVRLMIILLTERLGNYKLLRTFFCYEIWCSGIFEWIRRPLRDLSEGLLAFRSNLCQTLVYYIAGSTIVQMTLNWVPKILAGLLRGRLEY